MFRQPWIANRTCPLSFIYSMSSTEESNSSYSILAGLLAPADLIGEKDGSVSYDSWSRVNVGSYETDIGVDNVDKFLLRKARAEAEIVSNRLMTRMFGRRNRRRNIVTPIDTLKLFM